MVLSREALAKVLVSLGLNKTCTNLASFSADETRARISLLLPMSTLICHCTVEN